MCEEEGCAGLFGTIIRGEETAPTACVPTIRALGLEAAAAAASEAVCGREDDMLFFLLACLTFYIRFNADLSHF